jgi:hypothetical protein
LVEVHICCATQTRHLRRTDAAASDRFLIHVLPKGFHRIRHYGLLTGSARDKNLAQAWALLEVESIDAEDEAAFSPAVGWDRGEDRASNDADVSSIPLSFRTAGFPQYGWKAGLSGGAFPSADQVKSAPGMR